ncbi:MAG: UPF0280 family protein [Actinobacteria bacterium]|nr:UPF0280 family protein [Actinomycetota bacterium]
MSGPVATTTPDGSRLHLQNGPIDLIVAATGQVAEVAAAYRRAWDRFRPLLDELVQELPSLRRAFGDEHAALRGPVARRMAAAVSRFPERFVTPMAAVAGAVADEVCDAMWSGGGALRRGAVNDGGDIAIRLERGESFVVGLVPLPHRPALLGTATIHEEDPVRGVATSGRHGRSFSLGIADAVTVLAADAATADAAATLLADAVDLPGHPAIRRTPAVELAPDSDLGERLVTVDVGALTSEEIDAALAAGLAEAERMRAEGTIEAAVLCLEGRVVTAGPLLAGAPPGGGT